MSGKFRCLPIFLSVIITIAVTKIAINVTNVPTTSNSDSQILRQKRIRSDEEEFCSCCKFQSKVLKFSHYIIFTPTVTEHFP